MKVWHIPKAEKLDSFMLNSAKHECTHCDPMYNMKLREEMRSKVFQPGVS